MYSSLTALSREQHAALRLRPVADFSFAAREAVLPLAGAEIARAVQAFPMAFVAQADGAYSLVAVLGLDAGQNLYVSADGRWLGSYQPAALRRYPFALVHNEGAAEPIVCIDPMSSFLSEVDGQPLFAADGASSETLGAMINFLAELDKNERATGMACQALAAQGIVAPWEIKVQQEDGSVRQVAGLFRIDEARLNALDDAAFIASRQAGALPLAYAQLLSMSKLPDLGKMAAARPQAAVPMDVDNILGALQWETFRFL